MSEKKNIMYEKTVIYSLNNSNYTISFIAFENLKIK